MRAWLLVLMLLLAGCTAEVTGAPAKDDAPSVGPVSLVVPIEMRPVIGPSSTEPSGTELPDPSGARLTLADPIMVVERLDGAEIENTTGSWALNLDLTDDDAATFADWTAGHVGEQLAMVVDGKIVVAPEIQAAITGGNVQISGNYTRDEIDDLLDEITGR